MFGLICAGRLVQTNCQQVGETKWLFFVPQATSINHVVLFLTGQQSLPPQAATAIYFALPPYSNWKYLGYISNEKPSAIFKIGTKE